jgi:hypothetical protein
MTQTTAQTTGQRLIRRPTDFLCNLLVTLLAPMFFAVTEGDLGKARIAAFETIVSYRAETHASLFCVAKIIAFGLATLGSLSLSMDDDLPIALILKLRSNANALDRSSDRNERALQGARAAPAPVPQQAQAERDEQAALAKAQGGAAEVRVRPQGQAPYAEPAAGGANDRQYRAMWAAAMAEVAAEEAAAAADLPPAQRKEATARAAVLSGTANALLNTPAAGGHPPAPDFVSLMRRTGG